MTLNLDVKIQAQDLPSTPIRNISVLLTLDGKVFAFLTRPVRQKTRLWSYSIICNSSYKQLNKEVWLPVTVD